MSVEVRSRAEAANTLLQREVYHVLRKRITLRAWYLAFYITLLSMQAFAYS